jgi:hypothetical protein
MTFDLTKLMNTKEDLIPELVDYIDEPDEKFGFIFIRHPLINELYHEAMNAVYNARYKLKKEAVEEAREKSDWSGFVWLHERPFRFTALLEALGTGYWDAGNLTEEENELVESVWIDAENPGVNRDVWLTLFEAMPCEALNKLPKKFTIYRGTDPEDDNGISWTLSKKVAKFFADRFKDDGVVLTREIARSDALFYTDGRGEKEVIYDPT